eukprot:TRINITY_DN16103_c0_g1_i4.p1 TRINITY_DN16103_c0_g1~~TRINITY_DN16103_c0_g1_i4.p1  ORF type:complete len:103 (-),score=10.30 TRINITY_DN16103_c0_g1_i4:283-591(-)
MHHYISIHATHFVLIAATSNTTFCIWNGLWGLGIVATKHCRQDKLCKFNNASKRRMAEMVQDLWWKWPWLLQSLSWDRRIQGCNGLPFHEGKHQLNTMSEKR